MGWFRMLKGSMKEFGRQSKEVLDKDIQIAACPICGAEAEFDCSLLRIKAKVSCSNPDCPRDLPLVVERPYPLDAINSWNALASLEAYKRAFSSKFSTKC